MFRNETLDFLTFDLILLPLATDGKENE